MAYTANQAIKALNNYLGITDSDKIIIPDTKNRGFCYTLESGETVVIFVYPLVHKQDNTKNYFDTRDSGAYERGVAWNYAITNNMKYFCIGLNDSVEKYNDYVFSLECSELVVEALSGTKDGVRAGAGNQIIIPNDYKPNKAFERITNKLGTYIAAIHKDKLTDYLSTCDNRPYMVEAEAVDLSLLENEETIKCDDNEQLFREWLKNTPTARSESPASSTMSSYTGALKVVFERLDVKEYPEMKSFYEINDLDTFFKVKEAIVNNPDYDEVNRGYNNKAINAAMGKYEEFLKTKPQSDISVDHEDDAAIEHEKESCLDISREPRTSFIHPLNFIIYGAPGTGKTFSTAEYALAVIQNRTADLSKKNPEDRKQLMDQYKECVKNGQIVFTTFHQSFGYEEFIQGLRPDTKSEGLSFKSVDGTFKKIADAALRDAENNYVIIVDEINRGNISKIFGELITLIEEDKRWGELNELSAILPSGEVFAVPNNLYIIGTMNSADKSISLIDVALRRRFAFIEQKPDPSLIEDDELRSVFESLNTKLVDDLGSSDLLIGHSYFMNKGMGELTAILNNSIIPLLYEYYYDDKKKVSKTLNEVLKNTEIKVIDSRLGRLSVE